MPFVFTDAYIKITDGATDYELKCTKLTVEDSDKEIPATRMGDTAPNSISGLPKQSITAVFLQDYSAGEVHAALRAARVATKAGTGVTVVVRPDSAVASATNPQWTGTGMKIFEYKPVDGAADDKQDVTATFKTGGSALAYAVA